jgi:hypothetical protein
MGKPLIAKVVDEKDSEPYFVIGEWLDARTIKVHFQEDTEEKARATHHRMLFGEL